MMKKTIQQALTAIALGVLFQGSAQAGACNSSGASSARCTCTQGESLAACYQQFFGTDFGKTTAPNWFEPLWKWGSYELALDINGTGRLSYQGAFLGTYPVTLISAEKKTSWEYVYRGATKRYSTTGTAAFIIEVAGIALYHEHKQIPAIGAAGTGNYENYIQTCLANNVYGSCVSSPVVITAIQTAITLTPYPGF